MSPSTGTPPDAANQELRASPTASAACWSPTRCCRLLPCGSDTSALHRPLLLLCPCLFPWPGKRWAVSQKSSWRKWGRTEVPGQVAQKGSGGEATRAATASSGPRHPVSAVEKQHSAVGQPVKRCGAAHPPTPARTSAAAFPSSVSFSSSSSSVFYFPTCHVKRHIGKRD